MGTMILAAATTSKGSSYTSLLFIVVLVGVFYLLIMRPQRNRQRKAQQTQSQVMPGQRVRTTSGMYGTVISGDDRDIVIEIAPGVQVSMLRRAVMDVLPDEGLAADQNGQSDFGAAHEHEFDESHEHEFDESPEHEFDDTRSEHDLSDSPEAEFGNSHEPELGNSHGPAHDTANEDETAPDEQDLKDHNI
jgi:preprotein translocase subunit YajC